MANPFVFSRLPGAFRVGGGAGAARTFLGSALARPAAGSGSWLTVDTLAGAARPAAAPPSDPVPPTFPPRP